MIDVIDISMQIILNAGDAKNTYYDALEACKKQDFEKAEELLKEGDEKIIVAHKAQMDLLREEASGNKLEINILLVHAQDHLTMATMAKDFVEQIIELYKIVYGRQ